MPNCTGCGTELLTTAEACPACGAVQHPSQPEAARRSSKGRMVRPKFVLISVAVGIIVLVVAAFVIREVTKYEGINGDHAAEVERETIQISIQSLMVDKDLTIVLASSPANATTGEIISATSTQFHGSLILQSYMDQSTTKYCYRWSADGRITHQFDVDSSGACTTTKLYDE